MKYEDCHLDCLDVTEADNVCMPAWGKLAAALTVWGVWATERLLT